MTTRTARPGTPEQRAKVACSRCGGKGWCQDKGNGWPYVCRCMDEGGKMKKHQPSKGVAR